MFHGLIVEPVTMPPSTYGSRPMNSSAAARVVKTYAVPSTRVEARRAAPREQRAVRRRVEGAAQLHEALVRKLLREPDVARAVRVPLF